MPKDIKIDIIDGLSSFDLLINLLEIDPLEQGTTLLDANRLLLFRYKLETAIAYFIYHLSSVGNSKTNYVNPSLDNRLDLFKKYLLEFYNKEKMVFLCKVPNNKRENFIKIPCSICELEKYTNDIDYCTTLYIPAENPSRLDWEYLELVR